MYLQLHNENYGYATATYGEYVAVGNLKFIRYTGSLSQSYHTSSVDYFKYNKNTDQHDLVKTLYGYEGKLETLLARELNRDPLHTETGSYPFQDQDLEVDRELYFTSLEDTFGVSLDMYGKTLVVGCPYYTVQFKTEAIEITGSGSSVDIFDVGITETSSLNNPYVYSIFNPDIAYSESFGIGVAVNSSWLAVGSPYVSSSQGLVYMYQNIATASGNYSWSLFQKIPPPSASNGQEFGWSLKLNKQSGAYSASMVVGCGGTSSNAAYYFEYVSGSWTSSYTFRPTADILPLTIGDNYYPFQPTMSINSGYGFDVSLFENSVIVGAFLDRYVYEYTGSSQYQQGAVYIYEKCVDVSPTEFQLVLKTYGTPQTLKNNRLGYSVDIFGEYAVAGIPKTDVWDITPCFVQGTLGQLHYCEQDLEDTLNGQTMLLQKVGTEWEIVNVYQKKKRFLSPHRNFGQDVSIDGFSMVIGAPIYPSGSQQININVTQSSGVDIDDISGKAYIYNLHNLKEEFHVGNVFYRNGKIVIMTSGSAFSGLFLNEVNYRPYEYNLTFDAQRVINEKQILCNVEPGEFNVSTNPTALATPTSSLDLNKNGYFDFQDVDILLRYMKYKKDATTDWSSSVLSADDEISFYNWSYEQYTNTTNLWSSSFTRFENVETGFINQLDVNGDNKVDDSDMSVWWLYFANRLDDGIYQNFINTNCTRQTVSSAIEYLNSMSKRYKLPQIRSGFFDYDTLSAVDKTGSFLAPMVTTVGLYDGLDLVAVGKLGSPIKLPKTLPINFVVKMDF